MFRPLHHLRRDEQGMSMVFVSVGFMAFLSASTLAVDVGMLMTARSQAQNAADASALAAAVALTYNDFTDRSASGPAVSSAISTAAGNTIMGTPVKVLASDVTFVNDLSGQPTRVHVEVARTAARGAGVPTLIASFFGISSADITATAIAETIPANAEKCVKPWTIPDKWIEAQTPGWDTSDTFTTMNPSGFPDIFRSVNGSGYTGYSQSGSVGQQLSFTPEVGATIQPDMYFTLRLPGSSGSADYKGNITGCESAKMVIGDPLTIETAVSVADTIQAVTDIIAADPSAHWNTATKSVVSTKNPSPRVVVVPVYDTLYYESGKKIGIFTRLRISNFVGLFVDHVVGNYFVGYITPTSGLVASGGTPPPAASFPRAIRLVQ
jgi:Flp pilus assembly protein TadG